MSRIVILGGSGFLGKSLIKMLDCGDYKIRVMLHKNNIPFKVEKFYSNILYQKKLEKEIVEGDIIINLVGQFNGNLSQFIDLNLYGGLNLLEACKQRKNIRIILVSSINVYGANLDHASREKDQLRPETVYGTIKLMTEKIYKYYSIKYGIDVTVLRLANLYGPTKKDGLIKKLVDAIKVKSPVIIYNNGKQFRDFLFVEDATLGIVQAIKHANKGYEILNISSGQRYMINDVIKLIEKIAGKKINVRRTVKSLDEKCIWADNIKAKKIIKFIPKTTLETGLKYTISNLFDVAYT